MSLCYPIGLSVMVNPVPAGYLFLVLPSPKVGRQLSKFPAVLGAVGRQPGGSGSGPSQYGNQDYVAFQPL